MHGAKALHYSQQYIQFHFKKGTAKNDVSFPQKRIQIPNYTTGKASKGKIKWWQNQHRIFFPEK